MYIYIYITILLFWTIQKKQTYTVTIHHLNPHPISISRQSLGFRQILTP